MGLTTIGEIIKNQFRFEKNLKSESPIEDLFHNQVERYLAEGAKLVPQYEVSAMGMNFRIDFVIESKDKKVAVECDGKEFHNPARDLFRDAVLLGENKLDVVYRFYGKDLTHHIYECIYVVYLHEKDLFSKEGAGLIMLPLHDSFLRQQASMIKEDIVLTPTKNSSAMYASRRTKWTPKSRTIYASCEGMTASSIEDLAQQIKKKQSNPNP